MSYLHGYSPEEQERLYRQARFLENLVYEKIDFSKQNHILEIGCGVGAQTEILLDRFSHLTIQGIDRSSEQLAKAQTRLSAAIQSGRVALDQGDASHLPYSNDSFDGAFLSWFLEHVQEPVAILREIRRVLRTSSVIYCTETLNSSFYAHPYSPATLNYLFAFNDYQWSLKGDPFVGGKLGNYLLAAGFQNVSVEVKTQLLDDRTPKRRSQYIEYWSGLLLSGAPNLIQARKVTPEIVSEMKKELNRLKDEPNAVFFDCFIQAKAQAF